MRHRRSAHPIVVCLSVAALLLAACSSPVAEPAESTELAEEPPPAAEPLEEPPPAEPSEPPAEAAPEPEPPEEDPGPALSQFGVSAGDPDAVAAGMQILEAGGNAVDAAVAAAFAVTVVEPFASGIGGGGAAIVAWPDQEPVNYDYREVVAQDGQIPASDTGIPGFVAGMAQLLDEQGSLDLAEVLQPAIDLAREGTSTSETLATQLRNSAHRLPVNELPHLFPDGSPLSAGAPLVQDELADTLERLAEHGAADLYHGELAATLAARIDGIDEGSLAAYEVQRSTPPSGTFAGYEVHAASPPLPGVGLIQMLQVSEALGAEEHPLDSADLVHAIAMSWRVADRSIASDLGDPEFVDVPTDRLTDPARNAEVAAEIPRDGLLASAPIGQEHPLPIMAMAASPSPQLPAEPSAAGMAGVGSGPDAGNTTHLTVVDADGGMVSMTNTLTNFWGSGQYTSGFFLNDQLRRFSVGSGSSSNVAEPGRRSVSWSLPAMVSDAEGRPVLGLGSPGGRRIPMVLTQILVRWGLHGQSLEEAVAAPRFHLEGDELHVEEPLPGTVADDLRGRGYVGLAVPGPPLYFGSVQALEIDHDRGEIIGARDTRREADWSVGSP